MLGCNPILKGDSDDEDCRPIGVCSCCGSWTSGNGDKGIEGGLWNQPPSGMVTKSELEGMTMPAHKAVAL